MLFPYRKFENSSPMFGADDDDVNNDSNDNAPKQPKAKKRKSALEEEKEIYKVLAARGISSVNDSSARNSVQLYILS